MLAFALDGWSLPDDYDEAKQQAHLNNYFAAGFMILGNWQIRSDMQFRGVIHHVELHDKALEDNAVLKVEMKLEC